MAETATKMPVRNEGKGADRPAEWRPFESLRQEIDRLFEDFQLGSWRSPFGRTLFEVQPLWRSETGKTPAVDIVDTDKAYEITAELPGMDESNIDVKFSDGTLAIKGEKRDEKEEKKKGTSPSAATAPFTGHSECRTASMRRKLRQISKTAYSR
jgi:HSP20 family protein